MFTGIIEEVGRVDALHPLATGARLKIACATVLSDAFEGSSIAVNGVCLTALNITPASFEADLAPETLRRTNLGDLHSGHPVNLERPLAANGRFSGHVVQGHVDGTATLIALQQLGDQNWWLQVQLPPELDRYTVVKGSIALDGISLTVADLQSGLLSATIIPHTYEATALRVHRPGDKVNVECDIMAKYLEKFAAAKA